MQTTPTAKSGIRCTFCGKEREQVAGMVAGPGVHICDACVALCGRMMTGKATAAFDGWGSLTDDELLAALPASVEAVEQTEARVREHVAALRNRGVSWERIASCLGVSRQAAWERFAGAGAS
jgi:hypothetical protein